MEQLPSEFRVDYTGIWEEKTDNPIKSAVVVMRVYNREVQSWIFFKRIEKVALLDSGVTILFDHLINKFQKVSRNTDS